MDGLIISFGTQHCFFMDKDTCLGLDLDWFFQDLVWFFIGLLVSAFHGWIK